MDIDMSIIDAYSDGGAAEAAEEPLGSSLSDSTYEIISQSSFHTSDSEAEEHDSSSDDDDDDDDDDKHGDEVHEGSPLGLATPDEDQTFSSDEDYDENDNGIALQNTLTTRDVQQQTSSEISLQIPSPSMSSMSQLEASTDFPRSIPSLIDASASITEAETPIQRSHHCKFDEPPSSLRKDYVTVNHTVTNDFGWLPEHKTALMIQRSMTSLTIRQSMTAHAFQCKSPFRILYHGHPDLKPLIIEKIARALAISSDSEECSTEDSIQCRILSNSGFGKGKSQPGHIRIPCRGLDVIVEDCSLCAHSVSSISGEPAEAKELCSASILSLQKEKLASDRNGETILPSNQPGSQGVFESENLEANDQYTWPDLAIVTHISPGSFNSYRDRLTTPGGRPRPSHAAHFLHHHSRQLKVIGIPTLDILEQTVQPADVKEEQPFYIFVPEALHMLIKLSDQNFALKRIPIDFPSFLKLDISQLNRHIACLIQVYSSKNDFTRSKYSNGFGYPRATEQSLRRSVQNCAERTRVLVQDKIKQGVTFLREANERLELWPRLTLVALLAAIMSVLLTCFVQFSLGHPHSITPLSEFHFGSLPVKEMTTVYETVTVTPISVAIQSPVPTGPSRWISEAELVWSNIGRLAGLISGKQGEQKLYWKGVQFQVQQSDDGRILLLTSGSGSKAWKPLPGRVFIQHGENSSPRPANLRLVEPGVFEMLLPRSEISEKLLIGVFPDPHEDVFVTFSFVRPDSKSAYLKNPSNGNSTIKSVQMFWYRAVEAVHSTYSKGKSALSKTASSNTKKIDRLLGNIQDKASTPRNKMAHMAQYCYRKISRSSPPRYVQAGLQEAGRYLRKRGELFGHLISNLREHRDAIARVPSQIWQQLRAAQSRVKGLQHQGYRNVATGANWQAKEAREATQNTMRIAKGAVHSARERLLSLKNRYLQKSPAPARRLHCPALFKKVDFQRTTRNIDVHVKTKVKGKFRE